MVDGSCDELLASLAKYNAQDDFDSRLALIQKTLRSFIAKSAISDGVQKAEVNSGNGPGASGSSLDSMAAGLTGEGSLGASLAGSLQQGSLSGNIGASHGMAGGRLAGIGGGSLGALGMPANFSKMDKKTVRGQHLNSMGYNLFMVQHENRRTTEYELFSEPISMVLRTIKRLLVSIAADRNEQGIINPNTTVVAWFADRAIERGEARLAVGVLYRLFYPRNGKSVSMGVLVEFLKCCIAADMYDLALPLLDKPSIAEMFGSGGSGYGLSNPPSKPRSGGSRAGLDGEPTTSAKWELYMYLYFSGLIYLSLKMYRDAEEKILLLLTLVSSPLMISNSIGVESLLHLIVVQMALYGETRIEPDISPPLSSIWEKLRTQFQTSGIIIGNIGGGRVASASNGTLSSDSGFQGNQSHQSHSNAASLTSQSLSTSKGTHLSVTGFVHENGVDFFDVINLHQKNQTSDVDIIMGDDDVRGNTAIGNISGAAATSPGTAGLGTVFNPKLEDSTDATSAAVAGATAGAVAGGVAAATNNNAHNGSSNTSNNAPDGNGEALLDNSGQTSGNSNSSSDKGRPDFRSPTHATGTIFTSPHGAKRTKTIGPEHLPDDDLMMEVVPVQADPVAMPIIAHPITSKEMKASGADVQALPRELKLEIVNLAQKWRFKSLGDIYASIGVREIGLYLKPYSFPSSLGFTSDAAANLIGKTPDTKSIQEGAVNNCSANAILIDDSKDINGIEDRLLDIVMHHDLPTAYWDNGFLRFDGENTTTKPNETLEKLIKKLTMYTENLQYSDTFVESNQQDSAYLELL